MNHYPSGIEQALLIGNGRIALSEEKSDSTATSLEKQSLLRTPDSQTGVDRVDFYPTVEAAVRY